MFKIFSTLILIFITSNTYAGNAWYWGKVTSIRTTGPDGSFEINIENQSIKDFCKWDRVYFRVSDMGAERVKTALSMALAAFAANKDWGVVIDLPLAEDICSASSTASQGAGIR